MGERAIFFIAVSSEAQAGDDRESLPEQRRLLDDTAARFGWRVADVIELPGQSRAHYTYAEMADEAAEAGMPDALRLFTHWKRRDFDILAAINTTRLGRDQPILAEVIRRTIDAGARVYTVKDGWIDAQNQRMQIAMSGYSTGAEMDELRRRHEFGMRGRVRKGLPAGLVPGTHVLLRDASGKADRLIVDESKRRLFDDIYDLLTRERVIIRGMEAYLEARGHVRLGERVIDSWLRSLYTWGHSGRRFVAASQRGNWQWVYDPSRTPPAGVEIWRDTHEAVWQGDQAADIRAELDRRQATYGGHYLPYRSYRYSGLLVCANCGSPVAYRVDRDRYRYLRCNRTCGMGILKEAVVNAFMVGFLEQIVAGANVADLVGARPDTSVERRRQLDAEIDQTTAQAAALIRKQSTAPAALFTLYDDELTALAGRLDALERERARLQPPAVRAAQTSEGTIRARGLTWFWSAPEIEQNAILHGLFGRWRMAITNREVAAIVSARSS